jgi:D-alanyl-D-alanine carboxypeptidase/D-alanyl-D-alanine-endopeptidase (penicillin-binding protein 4)
MEFVNEMKTGGYGSGDNGYIYGSPYTFLRYLRGTIPMGKPEFSIKGSIPDPALFCAQLLKDCMEEKGQKVSGVPTSSREIKAKGTLPKDPRTLIYSHSSPPLKDIVFWLNKLSINLYAEHLLKYLGYYKSGNGTTETGAQVITNYWASKGIDIKGFHMMDGSGLSRYNGITPAQLAGILRAITKESIYESFYNSLPCAGDPEDVGSIRDMCANTAAAKNVRAKSGYIMRVRTYAGYVTTKGGRKLSFAMMPNNFTCSNPEMKRMLEELMVMLAEIS